MGSDMAGWAGMAARHLKLHRVGMAVGDWSALMAAAQSGDAAAYHRLWRLPGTNGSTGCARCGRRPRSRSARISPWPTTATPSPARGRLKACCGTQAHAGRRDPPGQAAGPQNRGTRPLARRGLRWLAAVIALCFALGWMVDASRDGWPALATRVNWHEGMQCASKIVALSVPAMLQRFASRLGRKTL